MDKIQFADIISNKLKSSYPEYAIKNMNLVSINKNNSIPIGTFSYSYTLYPSDIDVFEYVQYGDSEDKVVEFFCKSIQQIVRNIYNKGNYWILEVKVGIDDRYNFKITDPDAEIIIGELYQSRLLSDKDLEILSSSEEVANELLRKYAVLRWSPQEILAGIKSLPGNKQILLQDAIKAKSQINIEVIGLINGKFTDLSNFYVLLYTDKSGKKHVVNASDQLLTDFYTFFTTQLRANIKKMYYSPLNHDYYKLIKRYWSYGKITRDQGLINKILPIVNSPIALAGQKKSEIVTLIKLVEYTGLDRVPIDIFKNQVSNIKLSLAGVLALGQKNIEIINRVIDEIVNYDMKPKDIIERLEIVKDILKNFTGNAALKYLQSVGLAPPPQKYIN